MNRIRIIVSLVFASFAFLTLNGCAKECPKEITADAQNLMHKAMDPDVEKNKVKCLALVKSTEDFVTKYKPHEGCTVTLNGKTETFTLGDQVNEIPKLKQVCLSLP